MIVEERISKDGQQISRRANELGLRLRDMMMFDWNQMYIILIYEVKEDQAQPTNQNAQSAMKR